MKVRNIPQLILFIFICESAGLIGSIFTFQSIPTWYQTLNKPSFTPPGSIFGPVWTMLYFLMGISTFLIWQKGIKNKKVRHALTIFAIQLVLNLLWSIIFFGLRDLILASAEIVLLLFFIILTIVKFHKISRPAALLLIPYLLWSSFATILTFTIMKLN